MNTLQKNLLAALPEHLQNEHAISTIARLNHTTFEDAVSVVWIRYAEQLEKNAAQHNDESDFLNGLIRSQENPVIKLAQAHALTIKESETIINSQLMRLESATADELYNAGCEYLRNKTFGSARSQLRRELSAGSKKTFSMDSLDGEPQLLGCIHGCGRRAFMDNCC